MQAINIILFCNDLAYFFSFNIMTYNLYHKNIDELPMLNITCMQTQSTCISH